jgi:L-lactate dehydrogenase complex protein LldE
MKITLLVPCFVDALYPQVAIAVVRILEELGHTIDVAEDLNCCGQPTFKAHGA